MKEGYPLFNHWYQTLSWILDSVERFPKNARFSIASRISDAALDTMEGIIEAIYTKDRLHLLNRINLDIEKLRVLFRLANDRRFISMKQYEYIARELDKAGRMTGGWRKKLIETNRPSV